MGIKAFVGSLGPRLINFRDGLSNTFLIVEAGEAVPWTKPADLPYDPDKPFPQVSKFWAGGFVAGRQPITFKMRSFVFSSL